MKLAYNVIREGEKASSCFSMMLTCPRLLAEVRLVQAALGHLLTLRHDQVVSFARCDDLPGDAVGEPVT